MRKAIGTIVILLFIVSIYLYTTKNKNLKELLSKAEAEKNKLLSIKNVTDNPNRKSPLVIKKAVYTYWDGAFKSIDVTDKVKGLVMNDFIVIPKNGMAKVFNLNNGNTELSNNLLVQYMVANVNLSTHAKETEGISINV